jgi:hypothetical protein
MAHIRPATVDDARSLAPRLRQADVAEIEAGLGLPPLDGLLLSMLTGPSWAIVHDGLVIGIFGAGRHPRHQNTGVVWMLGSADVARPEIKYEFLQRSRQVCDLFNERYPVLTNYIDARNELHVRWIRWLGFKIVNTTETAEGVPFHEFARIKQCASS